jgi:phosphoribosylcarboxyaminoimidazole (NCAIR) mutase
MVLNAVERLAVIVAITYVWAAGKLDPTIAVVALTAVVGVSMGERRLKGGKGGASIVMMLAGFASTLVPHPVL